VFGQRGVHGRRISGVFNRKVYARGPDMSLRSMPQSR
jgi:hypothetical protein